MTNSDSWLLHITSQLLEPRERDAVLGDLTEVGANPVKAALEIIGLVLRRQAQLWKNWRPLARRVRPGLPLQLAPDGLLSVCHTKLSSPSRSICLPHRPLPASRLLLCNAFLLAAWSWTGGFVVGALSASHPLGQRRSLIYALCVLPGTIPHRIDFPFLPAVLPAAGDLGRLPRLANRSNQADFRNRSRTSHDRADHSHVEQSRPMDSELGAQLARLVSRRRRVARPPPDFTGALKRTARSAERKQMASELTLTVNGSRHTLSVAPETPLLFVLRNELKLTGPRLGCGMAQCGSCSVLLDGGEIRSCITPASYAVGKRIVTIEGLPEVWASQKGLSATEAANTLHPVQQAWIDEQVPQCGYCQSGMIIVAVQLLAKTPILPSPRLRTPSPTPHRLRISAGVALTSPSLTLYNAPPTPCVPKATRYDRERTRLAETYLVATIITRRNFVKI